MRTYPCRHPCVSPRQFELTTIEDLKNAGDRRPKAERVSQRWGVWGVTDATTHAQPHEELYHQTRSLTDG